MISQSIDGNYSTVIHNISHAEVSVYRLFKWCTFISYETKKKEKKQKEIQSQVEDKNFHSLQIYSESESESKRAISQINDPNWISMQMGEKIKSTDS